MQDILSYLDPTFISILEQGTFHYDSAYWSNKNEYNPLAGRTGFDSQETKLPTYWNTSFSKICLGMKVGNVTNFLVVNEQADSLHSLIADGQYRATSLGRDTWKTLIGSQASLQSNCNKEGFNAVGSNIQSSKARIGITNNEQNDCNSCDSRLGLGTGGYSDDTNTCGNVASHAPDNGDKIIKTMGYILVQWFSKAQRKSLWCQISWGANPPKTLLSIQLRTYIEIHTSPSAWQLQH